MCCEYQQANLIICIWVSVYFYTREEAMSVVELGYIIVYTNRYNISYIPTQTDVRNKSLNVTQHMICFNIHCIVWLLPVKWVHWQKRIEAYKQTNIRLCSGFVEHQLGTYSVWQMNMQHLKPGNARQNAKHGIQFLHLRETCWVTHIGIL